MLSTDNTGLQQEQQNQQYTTQVSLTAVKMQLSDSERNRRRINKEGCDRVCVGILVNAVVVLCDVIEVDNETVAKLIYHDLHPVLV